MAASRLMRSFCAFLVLRTASNAPLRPSSKTQRRNTSTSVCAAGSFVLTAHTACSRRYRLDATWQKRSKAGLGRSGWIGPLYAFAVSSRATRRNARGSPSCSASGMGQDFKTSYAHYKQCSQSDQPSTAMEDITHSDECFHSTRLLGSSDQVEREHSNRALPDLLYVPVRDQPVMVFRSVETLLRDATTLT